MRPDGLGAVLAPVARRLRLETGGRALAWGLTGGALAGLGAISQPMGLRAALAAVAIVLVTAILIVRARARWTARAAAAAAERHHPAFQNLLVTAEELAAHGDRAAPWMRERVEADALARAGGFDAAAAVPLGRTTALVAGAASLLLLALAIDAQRMAEGTRELASVGGPTAVTGGIRSVTIEIHPPAYTGLSARVEENPERLEVVGGTRLRVRVASDAGPVGMRLGRDALDVRGADEAFVAEAAPEASTYLAIEPDDPGAARLIAVQVLPDRAPAIRIPAPGRDLLLPPGAGPIPITAVAEDDHGLDALEIRYTKVSGSGEQFAFEEGTLPVRLTRESRTAWRAEATLPLDALQLEPGDSVVYRALARDARPGDVGLAASETFFVEIQGRGAVLLDGLEMPPEQERYALSQQMVVMKIERLREREKTMAPEAVREEAGLIAAEQRMVRANFIFLLGGHVEDEVEEAEHSHEIQEGRLENTARQEISRAIYLMTASETGLTAVNTGQALPPARAAVEALQRAFGRNRYILRSLAIQSRIDPSRRLTGALDEAAGWRRDPAPPDERAGAPEARALLTGVLAAASEIARGGAPAQGQLTALAEQAFALPVEAGVRQQVASSLLAARDALASASGRDAAAARLGDAAAPLLAEVAREARPGVPDGAGAPGSLDRAWTAGVRR